MKAITRYQADDGSVFDTPGKAAERDALLRVVAEVMAPLGHDRAKDEGCDFQNGSGYVQHSVETLTGVKRELIALSRKFLPNDWAARQENVHGVELLTVHAEWFLRFLDGLAEEPVADAWGRFNRIDKQGREWGQPYYADHPDEAHQVVLEDRTVTP